MGLDPGEGSGLSQSTTKHCMHCPFVHSVVHKPVELRGEEIQMTVLNESGDITDSQWDILKKHIENNDVGMK